MTDWWTSDAPVQSKPSSEQWWGADKPVQAPESEPATSPESPRGLWDRGQVKSTALTTDSALALGEATATAAHGFARGWAEGFGDQPFGLSKEDVKSLSDMGLYAPANAKSYLDTGWRAPFFALNELGIDSLYRAGQLTFRTMNGTFRGLQEAGRELGLPRDIVAMPEAFFGSPHPTGTPRALPEPMMGRVHVARDGTVKTELIGELPRDADFKTSAEILTPEPVRSAAVRVGDRVFEASMHVDAAEKAWKEVGSQFANKDAFYRAIEDGWATKDGKFLTQEEVLNNRALNTAVAEGRLRQKWEEEGIHPAEAVNDAKNDAFLRHDLTAGEAERIAGAAVKFDGDIYSAPTHAMAIEEISKKFGITEDEIFSRAISDDLGGFLTSTGRFVSRKEANEIAVRADQFKRVTTDYVPGGYLDSKDLRRTKPEKSSIDWLVEQIAKDEKSATYPSNVRIERILSGAEEGEIPLRALGSDVSSMPPLVPPSVQPTVPPGRLMGAIRAGADSLMDLGRDLQMKVAPMATGTRDTMAMVKDFANSLRRNRWEWARIDADVAKRFDPEQRKRMWDAADEESVLRQEMGGTEGANYQAAKEHMGLATLEPAERAAVEELQTRAQMAWVAARDLGMVEGEGLPAYTPRMMINMATAGGERALPLNSIGANLRVTTAGLKRRKYLTAEETEAAGKALGGEGAEIARDIRVLPLATAKLEDAVAGRRLIDGIKDYGKRTGSDTVTEGGTPAGSDAKWFTLDHPAFKTWRPKFKELENGKTVVVKDHGDVVFEQVPIYVRGDFEGPLRAVLDQKSGPIYGALMSLKGKTMGLIMNSPMIHNAVEWGRALPAMPGKVATFRVYFEGNRAKNDLPLMREAIDNGLVPIGKRFFNQDITGIMEAPDLTPGRSWTSQVMAFIPGLFDEGAGTAVKRTIDKAGDFWHNTLLWDRIGDLQMGLYSNMLSDQLAKSIDRTTASRVAAHWANRYAGALPKEAMSDAATKISNFLLFSRSFTMGNLGVMKDMLTGLPKDVIAQIERDAGFPAGSVAGAKPPPAAAEAVAFAKTMARRKAMSVVAADMVLMYISNSLLQSGLTVMRGDRTMDQEMNEYTRRWLDMMNDTKEHPFSLITPLTMAGAAVGGMAEGPLGAVGGAIAGTLMSKAKQLSSTSENEPRAQDRIKVGHAADGTAIYARNPVGKIGEEFEGYFTGPLDMFRRKQGTIARPGFQVLANDKGFGRKIYDPTAESVADKAWVLGQIAAHFAKSQIPEGQLQAGADLVKGEGDKYVNLAQSFGPVAGVTFSKGAPGGEAVGELYAAKGKHQYAVDAALPDIRKQIQRGDVAGASERMTELGIPPQLQRFYIKTSQNPSLRMSPRALRDFYLYATPEQRERMERAQ